MKPGFFLPTLFAGLVLFAAPGHCETPHLIKSIPADQAVDVSVTQGRIVLMFDQNMKMDSWSLMESGIHPFPPMLPMDEPWLDPLTFELKVKALQPGTTYAIQLNGNKRKGLVAAQDQLPLPVTTITFTTAAESVLPADKAKPVPQVRGAPPLADSQGNQDPTANEMQPLRIDRGWRFKVTRSIGFEGTESYQTGEQAAFRSLQKVVFTEEVLKTRTNTIDEARREIESARLHSLDPQAGQMMEQELVPAGSHFRLSHWPHGTTLFDGSSGQEIWDVDMVAVFAPPMVPRLWPQGLLQSGQKWSYQGAELVDRIGLIDVLGGTIELHVADITPDPSTGLEVAQIRGRLVTKVDLDTVVLGFDANVEIDLPLGLGVPFMVKFDGRLSGSGAFEDDRGQELAYAIEAKGTVLQIAQPANEVLAALGGTPVQSTQGVDTRGALRVPLNGGGSVLAYDGASGPGARPESSADEVGSSRTTGARAAVKRSPVHRYRLYEDVTEKAFTVLIPEGWKTEGGIMRIAPSQIQTIVDGCGKKLYFSIHDPDSRASITYFPTEIFHTSAPGTSWLSVAPGQVLNGMKQMPQVLTPAQYVAQIVFPSSRPDASNVQWGEIKPLTSLADAWNRAFHSEDPVPPRVIAESVEVAYDRAGTRFAELWTALITTTSVNTSTVWLPDFAVVAGGPVDRVEAMAPVLKAVITSFRMNPSWMANMIADFDACTKKVAKTQEGIREHERRISQRLMQVQKEIQAIDNDIVANRDATRSTIQEHEHNVLMGEDKYEDTGTGTRYLIDMRYERNFTDGETLIQTNDWLYEPPPGYRDMRNISITGD